MSKLYSWLLGLGVAVLALGAGPVAGQTVVIPPKRTCVTQDIDAQRQTELQRLIPGYDPTKRTKPITTTLRTTALTYTLPVVVHVIHNGEAVGTGTNLSQAQIQSQIDVLNEDYRKLNADGNNTAVVPAVFQGLRGDTQLQFQLALRDPNGNTMAEPGIDRVNRNAKGFTAPPYATSTIDATIKPATYWNPEQYINIWVLNISGGILGYAQFPDNTAGLGGLSQLGGTAATDGVAILYYAFGSRAKYPAGNYGSTTNPYDRGRTLTHELGHFFGMRHVWGDSDCGNDYVADTPTQLEENYDCPSFPHVTCSNGPNGDMFMNYMDYVNDACMAMFSADQAARMQAVMGVGTPRRTGLLSSPALCATTVASLAPVNATNSGPACAGSSVALAATGPTGATYYWTGPNNFTSTAQNPTLSSVTATMAGTYAVVVSVASGACPTRATTNVVVNPVPPTPTLAVSATSVCAGTPVTITASGLATVNSPLPNQDFNGTATGWTIASTGAAATAWQYSSGYTYSRLGLRNFTLNGTGFVVANSDAGGQGSTTNTTLTSPAFSTVGYSALSVSFQQLLLLDSGAGAVEITTDGGTTWTPVATYYDYEGTLTTSTINLAAYLNQASVQLRWHYTDAYGYLWAIDNVVFSATQPALTYTWTVVSGDGLPTAINTPNITVTPGQTSVYRLTVGYAGGSCTSSATASVNVQAVWSGAAGNRDWFDARNWQGCTPTRTTDALIPAGLTTPYPNITTGTAEVRTLTQQGSLAQTGGELAVYGDYVGTGTQSLTGGTVATRGTGAQALRPGTYATLLLAGTGTKTLGAATINTALTMAGAVLSTGTTTATLAPAATLSETDASYVLGQVQTTHNVSTTLDNFGGLGVSLTTEFAPGSTTLLRTTGQPQGTGTSQSISRYYDLTATNSRGLQGATLTLAYLPHELNGVAESQLTLFKSTTNGSTWTNEGVSTRDLTAKAITRAYVTDLNGRWTLAGATAPLGGADVTYSIQAFPVPFNAGGLSLQVSTPTAGPLSVQVYDAVGRRIYDHAVANVEVGTSTVNLPGSEQLQAGKYILRVQQANQTITLNVVRL